MEKNCYSCAIVYDSLPCHSCVRWSNWTPQAVTRENTAATPPDRIAAHAEWYRGVVERLVHLGTMIAVTYEPPTRGEAVRMIVDAEVDNYISVARYFDGRARDGFAARLAKAQKDLPPDIAEALAKHFWDLV